MSVTSSIRPPTVPSTEPGHPGDRFAALQRNRWCAGLAPQLRREIVRRCVVRRYPERTLVYAAGGPPSGCFFVLAGEVHLQHITVGGKYAFYRSLGTGDAFGMLSELDGSQRFSDARAWVDSTVLHLPHNEWQDLYRHDAAARDAFVALLCQQMQVLLGLLVESHSRPPQHQVAQLLVTLFDRGEAACDTGRGDAPRLTHEAIAAMAGLSRPTVSKVLHEMAAQGLIALQYGRLRLLQVQQIRQLAAAAAPGAP
jgi:CRP-like cAMP-binding protein